MRPCDERPGAASRGMTLLELLLVLSLLSLLVGLALPRWEGLREHFRLVQATRTLALDLHRARERAWIQGTTQWIQVFPAQGRYRTALGQYALPSGIRFGVAPGVLGPPSHPAPLRDPDGVFFPGNRIRFDPGGTASPGTLYLTTGTETRAITLALTGRIRIWTWKGGRWE